MSITTDALVAILYALLPRLPVIVVCLLGCVVAGVQARRLAGAAVWAVVGFALAAVVSVAAPASQALMPYWARDQGASLEELKTVFGVLGFLWSLLSTASFGMLIVAVLTGRPGAVPPPASPPPLPFSPGLP